MGNIKSSHTKSEFTSFPLLRSGHKPAVLNSKKTEIRKTSIVEADKILKPYISRIYSVLFEVSRDLQSKL